MAFNINEFVIDKPLGGKMFDAAGDILWGVEDFKDPKLSATTETEDAVDALGTLIMQFDRSKKVEFSATKAGLSLDLIAARGGVDKITASGTASVYVPVWLETTVADTETTITLAHTPYAEFGSSAIPYIWSINSADKTRTARFVLDDTTASATEFTLSTNTLTLPTGRTGDVTFLIPYWYESTGADSAGANEVQYAADQFPDVGKFVMEVLGYSKCDPQTKYYAWVIFPNAKLSCDIDVTLNPTTTDDFKLMALPDYCATTKTCFSIIVPEAT